jgi:hypothetical protein
MRSCTVEDAIRAVAHVYSQLGGAHKDAHGSINFQQQIKECKKLNSPPLWVKPIPILITAYIVEQVSRPSDTEDERDIVDMIVIELFFLLRPGGYNIPASDDTPFQLNDINLYVCGSRLCALMASDADIVAATSTLYTFTTQKNGHQNEKAVQGSSGDALCCPAEETM